ncbi:hypothetical protein V8G54_026512 [Vigna mungo]|uniref:Uncharacterized protein n=1 Tax=Vigna mungo TaxID=3915 RepID=A0AAQ3MZP9_VIGMU
MSAFPYTKTLIPSPPILSSPNPISTTINLVVSHEPPWSPPSKSQIAIIFNHHRESSIDAPNPRVATILTTSPQCVASTINALTPLHELLAPDHTTRTTLRLRHTIYNDKIIFFTTNLHCETFTNLNHSVARASSFPSSHPSRLHLQLCTQKNQSKNPKSNPDRTLKIQCHLCDLRDL